MFEFRRRYRDIWPSQWKTPEDLINEIGRPENDAFRLHLLDKTKPITAANLAWVPIVDVGFKARDNLKEYHRRKRHHRIYDLAFEAYAQMVDEQNGKCGICQGKFETFHIDHDHETGKVRGLLCRKCNQGMGMFDDDADRMIAAAAYKKRGGM